MADLTGANAVIMLAIANLFPVPQQIQGFAADDVLESDVLESAQTIMGVDGILSAGFVNVEVKQGYFLQADSPSIPMFDAWWAAQQTSKTIFRATGVILLTSLGTKWAMTRGVLTGYPPVPTIKKLAQPRKFGITWETISPAIA